MKVESMEWAQLRSGLGPIYEPFVRHLEQQKTPDERVAYVRVPHCEGGHLIGAALVAAHGR